MNEMNGSASKMARKVTNVPKNFEGQYKGIPPEADVGAGQGVCTLK